MRHVFMALTTAGLEGADVTSGEQDLFGPEMNPHQDNICATS